jgi:UDP-N-acetylglucosamine--N-acetylmuramyl-(pentapeptide) pyrophosphoryl-undecaprenol N-acetylglucosamine transferase
MNAPHLLIMAAGTGGHVIPGLAVAAEMRQRGWRLSWLGTTHGLENKLVPPSEIPLHTLAFGGMRGKGLAHAFTGAFKLLGAFWRSGCLMRQLRPTVVLGMGGYVCLPGGLMARLLRKPLMLVNADAALLLSNKALLPFAQRITFGFDGESLKNVPRSLVTGNPVRAEIETLPQPLNRFEGRSGALRLLVVGGSLGAQALNGCVPQALALIPEAQRPVVTHQTGGAHFESVKAAYAEAGVQANILPFIDDMAERLAACDLIVCRSGAITVSELCAGGVASVLVPLVVSSTSHQRDNAAWMAAHQAAIHLPQTELTPQCLADKLQSLQRSQLLSMATQARALARPHAAARVADEIEKLISA